MKQTKQHWTMSTIKLSDKVFLKIPKYKWVGTSQLKQPDSHDISIRQQKKANMVDLRREEHLNQ